MYLCIEHNQAHERAMVRWQGKQISMHRLAYCFTRGIEPDMLTGTVIRHTCDNPRCINPKHLLLGTHQDNMDDKVKRNRQAKGGGHGLVKLTSEDVLQIRKLYLKGSSTNGVVALGKQFNVSKSTIHTIVARKTWAHMEISHV